MKYKKYLIACAIFFFISVSYLLFSTMLYTRTLYEASLQTSWKYYSLKGVDSFFEGFPGPESKTAYGHLMEKHNLFSPGNSYYRTYEAYPLRFLFKSEDVPWHGFEERVTLEQSIEAIIPKLALPSDKERALLVKIDTFIKANQYIEATAYLNEFKQKHLTD